MAAPASAASSSSSSAPAPPLSFTRASAPVVHEHSHYGVLLRSPDDAESASAYADWLSAVAFVPAAQRVRHDEREWWRAPRNEFREEEPETRRVSTVKLEELVERHRGDRQKAAQEYAHRWLNYRKWISLTRLNVGEKDARQLCAEIHSLSEGERSARRSREIEWDVRELASLLAAFDRRREEKQWKFYLNFSLKQRIGRGQTRPQWQGEERFRRAYLYLLSWINKIHVRRLLQQQCQGEAVSEHEHEPNRHGAASGAGSIDSEPLSPLFDAYECGSQHALETALSGLLSFGSTVPSFHCDDKMFRFSVKSVVFEESPCQLLLFHRQEGAHVICLSCESHSDGDDNGDALMQAMEEQQPHCAHALFLLSWLGVETAHLLPRADPSYLRDFLTPAVLHRLQKSWQSFQHPTLHFLDSIHTIRLHQMAQLSFEDLWQQCRAALCDLRQMSEPGSDAANEPAISMAVQHQAAPEEREPVEELRFQKECSICLEDFVSPEPIVYCTGCRNYWHVGCWKNYKVKADPSNPMRCLLCRQRPDAGFCTFKAPQDKRTRNTAATPEQSAAAASNISPSSASSNIENRVAAVAAAVEPKPSSLSPPQLFAIRYCEPLQSRRRIRPLPLDHKRRLLLRHDVCQTLMNHARVFSVGQLQPRMHSPAPGPAPATSPGSYKGDRVCKIEVTLHPEEGESVSALEQLKAQLVQSVHGDSSDFVWSMAAPEMRHVTYELQAFGVCSTSIPWNNSFMSIAPTQVSEQDEDEEMEAGSNSSHNSSMKADSRAEVEAERESESESESQAELAASHSNSAMQTSHSRSRGAMAESNSESDSELSDAGIVGHNPAGCATFYFLHYSPTQLQHALDVSGAANPEELVEHWRHLTFGAIQQELQALVGLASNFHVLLPEEEVAHRLNTATNEFNMMSEACEHCQCAPLGSMLAHAYTPCKGLCNISSNEVGDFPVVLEHAQFDTQLDFAYCVPSAVPQQWAQETRVAILDQAPSWIGTIGQFSEAIDIIHDNSLDSNQPLQLRYRTAQGHKTGTLQKLLECIGPYQGISIKRSPNTPKSAKGDSGSLVSVYTDAHRWIPFAAHRMRNSTGTQLAMPIELYLDELISCLELHEDYIWILQ